MEEIFANRYLKFVAKYCSCYIWYFVKSTLKLVIEWVGLDLLKVFLNSYKVMREIKGEWSDVSNYCGISCIDAIAKKFFSIIISKDNKHSRPPFLPNNISPFVTADSKKCYCKTLSYAVTTEHYHIFDRLNAKNMNPK